jgi:hypothetical protein
MERYIQNLNNIYRANLKKKFEALQESKGQLFFPQTRIPLISIATLESIPHSALFYHKYGYQLK